MPKDKKKSMITMNKKMGSQQSKRDNKRQQLEIRELKP